MRNVIVTGGSRGLGLAITERLAGAGYQVIAIARRETEEIGALAARTSGPDWGAVQFHAFDLTDTSGLPSLVRGLHEKFGAIYGLVNNAALGTGGLLATMHDSQIERLVSTNILSPILFTKCVVRVMMAAEGSRIVNIGSIVAAHGFKGLSVYAATKAALSGFTRSLARELGPLGITVNAVAPGFLDTEMTHELNGMQRAQVARRSALQRLAAPEDVAALVAFLMSDEARNITGTTLTADAGGTA